MQVECPEMANSDHRHMPIEDQEAAGSASPLHATTNNIEASKVACVSGVAAHGVGQV